MKRALCIALLAAVASMQSAFADRHLSSDPAVIQSRQWVEDKQYAHALTLLRALPPDHPDAVDILFLRGYAALSLAQITPTDSSALLAEAIRAFRIILLHRPNLTRVRLELARAFFLNRQDRLAKRHFDIVLADAPPPPVAANIQRFLTAMRARRRWSGYFNTVIAPQANINRNTTILIPFAPGVNLPFELNEEESGAGLITSLGGDYAHPLSMRWRLIGGVDFKRTEYAGHQFDETEIKLHGEARFNISPGNEMRLQTAVRRDFDGDNHRVNDVYELTVRGTKRWSARLSSGGGVFAAVDRSGNGPDDGVFIDGDYYFTSAIRGGVKTAWSRTRPNESIDASRSRQLELRMNALLPRGFSADFSGGVQYTDYQRRSLVLNGDRRMRRIRTMKIGLLNRGWTIGGLSAKLSLIRQLSDSNYQLDNYQSDGVELGFHRQF